MAEKSIVQLRDEIGAAYESYIAELKEAGTNWERKPANGAEGEEAWSARQVAEHVASSTTFFANGIAATIGTEGPAIQRPTFVSADDAVTAMGPIQGQLMAVVEQVTDPQLDIEREFGPLGTSTLERVVGILSHHLMDHGNQLRTLRLG